MSVRIPWVLTDTVDTYNLPVNPDTADSPPYTKNMAYEVVSDDVVAIKENRDEPQVVTVSGVILTEDHLTQLNVWSDKMTPVFLTDDLGRTFRVYIKKFTPKREPTRKAHPWRHRYDMDLLVLGEE